MSTAEIRIIPYDQIVDKSVLGPGTLIGIGLPHTVDDFVRHIAQVISGVNNPRIDIVNSRLPSNSSIREIIDQKKLKRRFFGRLGESTALVLPTNIFWPKSKRILKRVDSEHPRAVNFLVATRMYTTGRKESSGDVVNEIVLCGDRRNDLQFYVKVRPERVSQTLKEVAACIEALPEGYARDLRQGLGHIYPDGLPSFGRNHRR